MVVVLDEVSSAISEEYTGRTARVAEDGNMNPEVWVAARATLRTTAENFIIKCVLLSLENFEVKNCFRCSCVFDAGRKGIQDAGLSDGFKDFFLSSKSKEVKQRKFFSFNVLHVMMEGSKKIFAPSST